jgi:hypothetical protein
MEITIIAFTQSGIVVFEYSDGNGNRAGINFFKSNDKEFILNLSVQSTVRELKNEDLVWRFFKS